MRHVKIQYRREEGGAYPLSPPSEMVMSDHPIAKGAAFGMDVAWDYSLIKVQDRNQILCVKTDGEVIRQYPRNQGQYRIPLGMSLEVPPGWSFYAHPFVGGGQPYVLERLPDRLTPLILFLFDDGFPMELKPRRVILKVIPIFDEEYHFEYSPME